MKTLRFLLVVVLISSAAVSCRKNSEKEKQDVVEDVNDAMEPMDNMIKKIAPDKERDSEDEMIQERINKIQDSISNEALKN